MWIRIQDQRLKDSQIDVCVDRCRRNSSSRHEERNEKAGL